MRKPAPSTSAGNLSLSSASSAPGAGPIRDAQPVNQEVDLFFYIPE